MANPHRDEGLFPRPLPALVLLAVFLAHAATIVVLRGNPARATLVTDLVVPFESALAAAGLFFGARHLLRTGQSGGRAWYLLALAQCLTMAGDITWAVFEVGLQQRPYPSLADVFYLAYYPVFAAGLFLMPGSFLIKNRRERFKTLLDMGITMLGGFLFLWTYVLQPTLARPGAQLVPALLGAAYPLCDLALLAGVLAIWLRNPAVKLAPPLWLVCAATVMMIISDTLFAVKSLASTYVTGDLLDLGWAANAALLALAGLALAAQRRHEQPTQVTQRSEAGWAVKLPFLGVAVVYALLVLAHLQSLPPTFLVLAAGTGLVICLLFLRQTMAAEDNRQLARMAAQELAQRRQAEAALAEERNLLRTLIDNLPHFIYGKDLQGRFMLANLAMTRLLGRQTPDEVLGRSDFDFFPAEMASEYQADEQALLARQQPLIDHEEQVVNRATGKRIWIVTTKVPLFDRKGELVGLVGVSRDITQRKLIELAEREQRTLAEALRDTAAALTGTLALNEVMERILANVGRVVAHDCANIMLIESGSARVVAARGYERLGLAEGVSVLRLPVSEMANLQQMLDTGQPMVVADVPADPEWVALPETRWNQSYAGAPIRLRGQTIGFIHLDSATRGFYKPQDAERLRVFADQAAVAIENARLFEAVEAERASLAQRVADATVELRTANEELGRAARLKDEFLASLSHELRTPLNAILIHSQTLGEGLYGELNARQLRSACTIEESGTRLLNLINNMIDLARIGAGKLQLLLEGVPVVSLCQAAVRQVAEEAAGKQINVSLAVDPQVEVVQGDERRLKQVLVNLLSNAVKFTPERGAIGLEVVGDAGAALACFTVWDTGIGIPADDLARLGQQFVQLDGSLARHYEGIGLGLTLAYRLAELHSGQMQATSTVGGGSRFTLSLPWNCRQHADAGLPA